MLLAGGQGSRLYALTKDVAKPSVPFGGKYRIIDFPLSNCANSGIDVVGVLTQYKPLQLNSYIGSGQAYDLDSSDGGVFILPPYQSAGEVGSWFSGTANAIYQNMAFIENYDPENVLILSGDHIYKMDYSDMLREHVQNNADCTIAVKQVSLEEATRFGILSCGEDGYINDFGKNIIPNMLAAGEKLWPYRFDGYWRDVGTIVSLWDANMDMLSSTLINLYDPDWPIRSKSPIKPPHYAGPDSKINHSIVTEGCEIYGEVDNSVLSSSVTVGRGAQVFYSILMPGSRVEDGAVVKYAIIGENTVVRAGARVGADPDGSENWNVATCGPGIEIGAGATVKAGAMIYDSVPAGEGGEE